MRSKENKVIVLDRELVKSKAFRKLRTVASVVVLMTFMTKRVMRKVKYGKRKGWRIENNGEVRTTGKAGSLTSPIRADYKPALEGHTGRS